MKVKNDLCSFFFRCLLSNCLSWNINCDDQGCHGQGKVREIKNFSRSGKSQGILLSRLVKFMKTFLFGKLSCSRSSYAFKCRVFWSVALNLIITKYNCCLNSKDQFSYVVIIKICKLFKSQQHGLF